MKTILVTYHDGYTTETNINGTKEEIEEYYIGKRFNFGDNDFNEDDLIRVAVDVKILGDQND